ncbi:MAG: exonuclease domain-containing protein [Thermomicrobiales bacterium]
MDEHARRRWATARSKAIAWAVGVSSDPRVVYLDTETTGFGARAEIVDIAVVNAAGQVLLESLVQPNRHIPADATAVHGITDADVEDAPAWCDLHEEVLNVLTGRRIVVDNVIFDRQMVNQACDRYSLDEPAADWECAMRRYAGFHGSWDARKRWYRFQKLERAVLAFGAEPGGHRAAADALACRAVVLGMAATALPESEHVVDAAALDAAREWHVPAQTANAVQTAASEPDQPVSPIVHGSESDAHQRWVRAANTFLALVDGLPTELRECPGACGVWSVREVVAHCAGWEWEAARRLRLIVVDPTLPDASYEPDRFNGASVAARARQDWAHTLDELEKANATLAKAGAALPDDVRAREWLLARAADFEEHTAGIERWIVESGSIQSTRRSRAANDVHGTRATL